jgi:hypothetical protein
LKILILLGQTEQVVVRAAVLVLQPIQLLQVLVVLVQQDKVTTVAFLRLKGLELEG